MSIQQRIDNLEKELIADVAKQEREYKAYSKRFEADVIKYTKQVQDNPRDWTGRSAKDGKIYFEGNAKYPSGYYTPKQHGRIRASQIYAHNQQFKPWTVPKKVGFKYAPARDGKVLWEGSENVKSQYVTPAQYAKLAVTNTELQKNGYDKPWYEQVKNSLKEEFSGEQMKRAGVFGFKSILMDTNFLSDAFRDTNKAMEEADEYSGKDFAIDSAILALSIVGGELAGPFVGRAIQDLKGSLDGVIATAVRDGSVVAQDGSLILLNDAEKARLQRLSAVEDEKWAEQIQDYENKPRPKEEIDRSQPKEEVDRSQPKEEIEETKEEGELQEFKSEEPDGPALQTITEDSLEEQLEELEELAEQRMQESMQNLEDLVKANETAKIFTGDDTERFVNSMNELQSQTDLFIAEQKEIIRANETAKIRARVTSQEAQGTAQSVNTRMTQLLADLDNNMDTNFAQFEIRQRARYDAAVRATLLEQQQMYEALGNRAVAGAIGSVLHGMKQNDDTRRKIRDDPEQTQEAEAPPETLPEAPPETLPEAPPTEAPPEAPPGTHVMPDGTVMEGDTHPETQDPYSEYDDISTFNTQQRQRPKILGYIYYPANQEQDYLNQYVKF